MEYVLRMTILPCMIAAAVGLAAAGQGSGLAKGQNIHRGELVFVTKCLACHSVNQDEARFGPSLYGEMKKRPLMTAKEVRGIVMAGKGKMPAFKDSISSVEVDDLIAYLRTL